MDARIHSFAGLTQSSVVDYLDRIFASDSIEDIWSMHIAEMSKIGFDRLLYAFTRFRTGNSLGNPDDSVILSNHTPEYLGEFIDGGLYLAAPMVKWAARNCGAISWRHMAMAVDTPAVSPYERRLQELNRRFNVQAGYSIGFREVSTRAKGGIGLCARAGLTQDDVDALWARCGREIETVNKVIHLRIANLPYLTGRPLTARQREALEWVGDGKTTQDIATIMGLTPATIEKHLRLAREVLDVETTAQAVLKASFRNQIFVVQEARSA